MTCIDIWFTRSNIKVRRVLLVKYGFRSFSTICHWDIIFHFLIGIGEGMTPIDFGFTRSKVKVTRVTLVTKIKKCIPLNILRIIYHTAFIFHMLIGLSENMTRIDIWFTRSKLKVRRVILVKYCFRSFSTICHWDMIFHFLIGIGEGMTPFDFGFTRLKVNVTRVLVKNVNMLSAHYHDCYLSQSFHISHTDWSWWGHKPYWLSLLRQRLRSQGSLLLIM